MVLFFGLVFLSLAPSGNVSADALAWIGLRNCSKWVGAFYKYVINLDNDDYKIAKSKIV